MPSSFLMSDVCVLIERHCSYGGRARENYSKENRKRDRHEQKKRIVRQIGNPLQAKIDNYARVRSNRRGRPTRPKHQIGTNHQHEIEIDQSSML